MTEAKEYAQVKSTTFAKGKKEMESESRTRNRECEE